MEKEDVMKYLKGMIPLDTNSEIINLWAQLLSMQFLLDKIYPTDTDIESLEKQCLEYVGKALKEKFPYHFDEEKFNVKEDPKNI